MDEKTVDAKDPTESVRKLLEPYEQKISLLQDDVARYSERIKVLEQLCQDMWDGVVWRATELPSQSEIDVWESEMQVRVKDLGLKGRVDDEK